MASPPRKRKEGGIQYSYLLMNAHTLSTDGPAFVNCWFLRHLCVRNSLTHPVKRWNLEVHQNWDWIICLQDIMLGRPAHEGKFSATYLLPSMQIPPLVPHWLSYSLWVRILIAWVTTGWGHNLPGICFICLPKSFQVHITQQSYFKKVNHVLFQWFF